MVQRDIYKPGGTSQKDVSAMEQFLQVLMSDNNPKVVTPSAPAGVTNLLITCAENYFEERKLPAEFYHVKQRYMDIFHRIPDAVRCIETMCSSFLRQAFGANTRFSAMEEQLGEKYTRPFRLAYIKAFGERLQERVLVLYLKAQGIPAETIPARTVIKLSGNPENATYERKSDALIAAACTDPEILYVIGGFHGSDDQGNIMVFSRGGSDYTQTIVARALKARACYNCTDVPGIYPIDPQLLSGEEQQQLKRNGKLRSISYASYQEAQELAKQGAKVIHPKALDALVDDSIPFYVLDTFHPSAGRTEIGPLKDPTPRVTGITGKKGPFHSISLRSGEMEDSTGYVRFVGEAFAGVNIETVTTSRVGIGVGFSDPKANLSTILSQLSSRGQVQEHNDSSFVALVGVNLGKDPSILARFFTTLAQEGIPVGQVSKMSSDFSADTGADFSLWAEIPIKDYERAQRALFYRLILGENSKLF